MAADVPAPRQSQNVAVRIGRPPDAAKRCAILAAAQRYFLAQGYAATSMDQLAAAAGVSKPTAYRHFGSKDALFQAAVTSKCEAMLGAFDNVGGADTDAHSALSAFGRAFLALIFSPDALRLHQLVISEQGRAPQLGALFYGAAIEPTRARLAALLDRLGRNGGEAAERASDLLMLWRGKPMLPVELGLDRWDLAMLDAHVTRTVTLCLRGWADAR